MKPDTLTLADASKVAPGRPSTSAIWRWCRKGILARNGERVHLPHLRVGRRIFVEPEALATFFRRVAQADTEALAEPSAPVRLRRSGRSQRERDRAIADAREELRIDN